MKILNKEVILGLKGGEKVSGYIYISNYSENPTKTGKTFLNGVCHIKGEVQFKVWQNSEAFNSLVDSIDEYRGKVCGVIAKIDDWGGVNSLVLEEVGCPLTQAELDNNGLSSTDFIISKYNSVKLKESTQQILEKYVSSGALRVYLKIMSLLPEGRFWEEFAAIHHHDNCIGGLAAHTWKVLKLSLLLQMYPSIMERVSLDALFVGCAIHDIGKVYEYDRGVISEKGKVLDHTQIGVMFLCSLKDFILHETSEDFYMQLISIVSQHHGEYGARPRTVIGYIVHQLDMFESTLAGIDSSLENVEQGVQVSIDDLKLS